MMRHNTGPSAHNNPCNERTDNGVSETDPCRRDTVFPTELSRIADKDNGREIRCAVCKSGKPRSDASTAKNEIRGASSALARVESYGNHTAEK